MFNGGLSDAIIIGFLLFAPLLGQQVGHRQPEFMVVHKDFKEK